MSIILSAAERLGSIAAATPSVRSAANGGEIPAGLLAAMRQGRDAALAAMSKDRAVAVTKALAASGTAVMPPPLAALKPAH